MANSLASILDLRLGHSPSTIFFNGFLIDSVSKLSKLGHDLLGRSVSSSKIYIHNKINISNIIYKNFLYFLPYQHLYNFGVAQINTKVINDLQ